MKKFFNKKRITILVALALMVVSVTGTLAVITANGGSVTNSFSVADVNTHLIEYINPSQVVNPGATITKEVAVVNDGPTVAYIRARITVSPDLWHDGGDGIQLDVDTNNWLDGGDGFYYFKYVTDPSDAYNTTKNLFNKVTIGSKVETNFDITVYQEAVHAIGKTADFATAIDLATMKAAFDSIK